MKWSSRMLQKHCHPLSEKEKTSRVFVFQQIWQNCGAFHWNNSLGINLLFLKCVIENEVTLLLGNYYD